MSNPTAQEQEFLELINRLRTAPREELALLLNSSDPTANAAIDDALKQFGTNRATLRSQWDKLSPAAPLAWSSPLNQAAAAHNQAMIAADIQSHDVSGEKKLIDRLADAGYDISKGGTVAENIFAAVDSIVYAQAGLAIDWGADDPNTPQLEAIDGIQTVTGHRDTLLATDLREVGVAVTATTTKINVGPTVVTQNFGNRSALDGKAFMLGVAYDDKNSDGYYQAGEGLSDVQVKITGVGNNFSQTLTVGEAGGYQQLVNPGEYSVEFSRNGVVIQSETTSIVANQNVKLGDVVIDSTPPDVSVQNTIPDLVKRTVTPAIDDKVIAPTVAPAIDDKVVAPTVIPAIDDKVVAPTVTPAIDFDKVVEPTMIPVIDDNVVQPTMIPVIDGKVVEPTVTPVIAFNNVVAPNLNALDIKNSLVLPMLGSNLQDNKSGSNLIDFTRDFTQAAILDLTFATINAKFTEVSADASYHNYAGLYRVDDASGKIGNLNPGDAGYMTAALQRSKEVNRGVELDRDGISAKNLDGGYIYAPFVVADGTVDQVLNSLDPKTAPRVYFNFVLANADGFDHIKSLGANKFAFEDTYGGGDKDYNDLIFKVEANVVSVVG